VVANFEMNLSADEGESLPQFEQEPFQVRDEALLEFAAGRRPSTRRSRSGRKPPANRIWPPSPTTNTPAPRTVLRQPDT
jgi:hypothetical protein